MEVKQAHGKMTAPKLYTERKLPAPVKNTSFLRFTFKNNST